MMKYYLVTPVYNEESNVVRLLQTVNNQTIKPLKWIIVNNGSTDETENIIIETARIFNIDYIELLYQERAESPGTNKNFANAVFAGFDFLLKDDDKSVGFIGKIDADVILPTDFFEKLLEAMVIDEAIGIVSGKSYTVNTCSITGFEPYETILKNSFENFVMPGSIRDIRLYRKDAIISIGGMPLVDYAPDTATLLLIKAKGWNIFIRNDVSFILIRETNCNINNKKAIELRGRIRHYYGSSIIMVVLDTIYLSRKVNLASLYIFVGYFKSFIHKLNRAPIELRTLYNEEKTIIKTLKNYTSNGLK